MDLAKGLESRCTFEQTIHFAPVWSPDGARIVFATLRNGYRAEQESSPWVAVVIACPMSGTRTWILRSLIKSAKSISRLSSQRASSLD
ncbi:MAG TPA: hypothetical protein DHU55_16245 [Blastocatellia bacterium]|nr:hypothetical protein [Blastocatellia bacterium]